MSKKGDNVYTLSKSYSIKSNLWERFSAKMKEGGFSPSYVIRRLIEKWLSGEVSID